MAVTGLIELVSNLSLDDLTQETEKARQIMEEKRRIVQEAENEYYRAQTMYKLVESARKMREGLESENGQNGHSPSIPISATDTYSASLAPTHEISDDGDDDGPDKTAYILLTIQRANGLKPGHVYKTLLSEGVAVRRSYISTVLQRLKKRGQVRVEDGKYYAV